eukprot:1150961-Pelagomonas_calceolata.AAC.17
MGTVHISAQHHAFVFVYTSKQVLSYASFLSACHHLQEIPDLYVCLTAYCLCRRLCSDVVFGTCNGWQGSRQSSALSHLHVHAPCRDAHVQGNQVVQGIGHDLLRALEDGNCEDDLYAGSSPPGGGDSPGSRQVLPRCLLLRLHIIWCTLCIMAYALDDRFLLLCTCISACALGPAKCAQPRHSLRPGGQPQHNNWNQAAPGCSDPAALCIARMVEVGWLF